MSPEAALTTAERAELLERFKPSMRYDSLESYFADAADIWLANPHCRLSDAKGRTIATAADGLSLDYLRRTYPDGSTAQRDDFTESTAGEYSRLYAELRAAHPDLRNVIYGRTVDSHQRLWLQYWFFYFFNDYQLAWGIGVHEGDWEMIQLRMKPDLAEPELAVYAQHNFCEIRPWGAVTCEGDRPVVFAGRGSHASFFESGFHSTDFYDVTDGERQPKNDVRLEVVDGDPPEWLKWPGRWGGRRAGGNGPAAPCSQSQWDDPEQLMERQPRVREREPAPDAPRVMARRRRGRLLLEFDFSSVPEPPRWIVATVNSSDEKEVPPRAHSFGVEDAVLGSLHTRIEIDPKKHYDVAMAVVDREDRPTGAEIVVFGPARGWKGLRGRLGAAAGRLVHLIRLAFGKR